MYGDDVIKPCTDFWYKKTANQAFFLLLRKETKEMGISKREVIFIGRDIEGHTHNAIQVQKKRRWDFLGNQMIFYGSCNAFVKNLRACNKAVTN